MNRKCNRCEEYKDEDRMDVLNEMWLCDECLKELRRDRESFGGVF